MVRKLTVCTDFRLKAMTFDNVPWVITMKKNDHYFPTMEWVKDPSEESGWKRVTYEHGRKVEGEGKEGVLVTPGEIEGGVGAEDEGIVPEVEGEKA